MTLELSSKRLCLGAVLLCLISCSRSKVPESEISAAAAAPPPVCQASAAWISNPSEPAEVAATETFCDFYQFSWQWFLAQVSPANPSNPSGDRVFETKRLVDLNPTTVPDQCSKPVLTGRAMAAKLLALRDLKPVDFEDQQADGNPLYDQAGNILYYNIWYSAPECNATATGFVAGTLEIKAAWRILPGPDPTYYTMSGSVTARNGAAENVTLGLVGFHLVNWTSKHPEFLWASFEHKSNAPLCDGSNATAGWSLTSEAAAQCLAGNPVPNGQISPSCAQYKFNSAEGASSPKAPPPTDTPDQVCRLYANGNQPGTSINGNDNAANLTAITQLNDQLVGSTGLLTQLRPDNPMAVWANYHMIGSLWTKGGAASGAPPVTHAGQPGDPNSPQRGSLELTNMTMETFEQGDSSPVPNCFGCHGYLPTKPLQVSHIAIKYLLPSTAKQ